MFAKNQMEGNREKQQRFARVNRLPRKGSWQGRAVSQSMLISLMYLFRGTNAAPLQKCCATLTANPFLSDTVNKQKENAEAKASRVTLCT